MEINNNSRFAQAPSIQMQRSAFNRPHTHLTSCNAGDLIPVYVDSDILPGDTVSLDMSFVTRMSTPIHPVYGNANVEFMWFFVPHRLVYDNFEAFMTEGRNKGAWDPPRNYEPPMIKLDGWFSMAEDFQRPGFPHKSLGDYMGLPSGIYNEFNGAGGELIYAALPEKGVNALPFRAYAKIWNDWFRASTIQEEIMIPTEEEGLRTVTVSKSDYTSFSSPADWFNHDVQFDTVYGGKLLKANKYHDFFTSALLEPQAGEPVGIPLSGVIPVSIYDNTNSGNPFQLAPAGNTYTSQVYQKTDGDLTFSSSSIDSALNWPDMKADVSAAGTNINVSINDLRHAIAIQHILETDARSGFTYKDLLRGHFSVTSPDARLQRSEFLGGTSVPVNIDQVLQTSATNDVSPQGNTGAYSLTSGTDSSFEHSFTEHGTLMCLMCVRHIHTYQQGIEKMWMRYDRYDYYWPELANISEQPVMVNQLFASNQTGDDEVFGYNEAFAEYRFKPSICSSSMRSSYPQSLDVWHYADYYTKKPHLSSEWMQETSKEIDRTLAVSSDVEDQFIFDIFFNPKYYRVMPLYSVPGLDRL